MLNNSSTSIAKIIETTKSLPKHLSKYFGLTEIAEEASDSVRAVNNLIEQGTCGASPLADYLHYRYYDVEKQLFFNDGDFMGFFLEVSPIVGVDEGLLKNLSYFFNDELPEHSYLQFLLVASHEVGSIVGPWQKLRQTAPSILAKLGNKRAGFIQQMATHFGSYDGRIARNYRIFLSFSQFLESTPSNILKVQAFKEIMGKKFATLNLSVKICTAGDLISLVRELVQMNLGKGEQTGIRDHKDTKYDPINLLADQILLPLVKLEVKEDRVTHSQDSLVTKSYYARNLPREFSLHNMLSLLGSSENNSLGIPARFVISYTVSSDISSANQAALVAKGTRVIDAAEQWYSRNDRNIKREAAEWKDVNDRAKNGEKFLTEHFSVMITAPALAIDTAEQALVSLYNILEFRLEVNKNLQLPALFSTLPMQQGYYFPSLKSFKLTRQVLSSEAIARLPIHAEWKGVPKPGVLLHARRGQLFSWNPFYRISSGNYNVCVFGPSGGGKSVFLQELTTCMLSDGTQVFVLDIGQSFANICRLVEGEVIQFSNKDVPLSLNPFASFQPQMKEEDRVEFLKCAKGLLSIMCGIKEDDSHGLSALEKAIQDALEVTGYKLDINSFVSFLNESNSEVLKRFGATLYSYTEDGIYGKYFIGSKAATFKRSLTIFEFEEIKNDPKLLSIVLQILLMEVTNQFLTGDRTRQFMIIVDEAWMLLDFAAPFFAAFVRTVRKYGGSLVVCVQNFMDLQKTIDHRTILENSTWTILLKQDEKGLEAFKSSEAFKDMLPLIRSISLSPGKYSEVLLYATGVRVVGRLVLDNYSKTLYSTDAADFSYLKNATEQGIPLEIAIESLATQKYGESL